MSDVTEQRGEEKTSCSADCYDAHDLVLAFLKGGLVWASWQHENFPVGTTDCASGCNLRSLWKERPPVQQNWARDQGQSLLWFNNLRGEDVLALSGVFSWVFCRITPPFNWLVNPHGMFSDNKPHIRLSWHNKIVTELLSSESDCHTLWMGRTSWKVDRFSKIASANWTGSVRRVPQVAEEKLKLPTGPAAGKQFFNT